VDSVGRGGTVLGEGVDIIGGVDRIGGWGRVSWSRCVVRRDGDGWSRSRWEGEGRFGKL
jgi:hypothetical protein